jgi:hypothetical protein
MQSKLFFKRKRVMPYKKRVKRAINCRTMNGYFDPNHLQTAAENDKKVVAHINN